MRAKHLSYVSAGGKGLLGKTVGAMLRETAHKHPKVDAIVNVAEKTRWSYKELLERSEAMAEGLVALGLPKQTRVGIFAPNCKDWTLTQCAAAMADLILVNVNPASQETELEYSLNKVQVDTLIMPSHNRHDNYIGMIEKLAPEIQDSKIGELNSARLPHLRRVILTDNKHHKGMMRLEELMNLKSDEYITRTQNINFEDPYNIQFTSGTTGKPKAATLSHHNAINNGFYCGEILKYTHHDRVCIPVPVYHCLGMIAGNLACISHGSTMIYPDAGFNPVATMDTVENEKCTSIYGVPTMYIAYLREQQRKKRNIDSLRTGVVAGSVCTPELMKKMVDQLHLPHVTNCYGMTETSPVSFQLHPEADFEKRISTVGVVHPHGEAKIIDRNGQTVERGEIGELCTRGYFVMKYYWGDQKATNEAIDADGWMHTGDLSSMDEDGYVKIVGRSKDLIIWGGENIYPAEVENFLQTHPDIEDVAVFGIPDERFGEQVCAWIKMKPDKAPVTHETLAQFCRGKIAKYKVPKIIKVVDSFPLTISGKIMKYVMKLDQQKELELKHKE
ncbi:unnamed protein product [Blepharisma stoltei]|uniref:Uncharacterized protein n=1 Tax=Blepharisma stoltei TaxID=1481888 RepID=A0AAU9JTF4_9CILI|nr:unnamed protein product [Blepharisma stoltei]